MVLDKLGFAQWAVSVACSVFRSSYHNGKKPQLNQTEPEKKPNWLVAVIQFLEIISCSCLNLGSKKSWLQPVATGYFRGIQRVPYVPGMQGKMSTFSDLYFLQGKYRSDLFDVSEKVVSNDCGNVEVHSHGARGST